MTQAELETVKLEQLASEYRRKGYEVVIHPHPPDLPQFLSTFQLDMIATSRKDNVVVEIKSSADLISDVIVRLAEAIETQARWRLEIAVVNPTTAQELPVSGELVPDAQVQSLLREALDLKREQRYEAATIVAWSAAEAILRRLAQENGIEAERKSSDTVLKQLYASGLIDPGQYESFARAMQFRNAFAHGFAASVAPDAIEQFIHDVENLRSNRAA